MISTDDTRASTLSKIEAALTPCDRGTTVAPIGWESVHEATWSTSRAMTTLKERLGYDPFHAYDGTDATWEVGVVGVVGLLWGDCFQCFQCKTQHKQQQDDAA